MKRRRTIDWIAVFAEDGLAVWNREGQIQTAPRPQTTDADAAWDAARPLVAAPRGASGLLLSSDFFSQTIRLPARQSVGLSADELRQALAYEVQPFSRIAPDAGLLGYAPLPSSPGEDSSWELVQVPRADAEALRRAVRASRLRLAGLGAPPRGFLAAAPDAAALAALADGVATQPIASPNTSAPSPVAAAPLRQTALAAALVLCLGTYVLQSLQLSAARREVTRRERSAQGVERLRDELRDVRRQCDDIVRARDEAAEAARRLVIYRGAWAALLRSLAAAGGNAVVRDITSTGAFAADVRGYGADEAGPSRAMAAIATEAARSGWTIQPGSLRAAADGIVRFSFRATLDPTSATLPEGGTP